LRHSSVTRRIGCQSPISRPSETIDVGIVGGRATRDPARRSDPRCDPIRVVDASRPPARAACPAPQMGRPGAFESVLRPSDRLLWLILRRVWRWWRDALVLVQPATVASVAPRSVRSPLVAPFATSWDHASIRRVAISLGAWPRRTGFGARRVFTANCSSSESSSQNARCRVTCENGRRDDHRAGAHLSRLTSASSNSYPSAVTVRVGR
jgi:hypothetical protein